METITVKDDAADTIDITPVLAVAIKDCLNEESDKWEVLKCGKFDQDYARGLLYTYASSGKQGDYYGVVEFTSTGARLCGETVEGTVEW